MQNYKEDKRTEEQKRFKGTQMNPLPTEGSSISRYMKKEFKKTCADGGACGFYNMCDFCYNKVVLAHNHDI